MDNINTNKTGQAMLVQAVQKQTTDQTQKPIGYITKAQAEQKAVDEYCNSFPNPEDINLANAEGTILHLTYILFDMHNQMSPKNEKWNKPQKLEPHMIADMLLHKFVIRNLNLGGDGSVLAIYADEGPREGTYVLDPVCPAHLERIIRSLSPLIKENDVKEVRACLQANAPCAELTKDPNLIIVANGIFDYHTKELKPFSPDYVSCVKLATAYRNHPENPVIHNDKDGTDWDVESWMASLSDDPEIVDLLWRVPNVVVRPLISWKKLLCFSGNTGCNGKSSLVDLVGNMCGSDYWGVLSISDCCDKFFPANLISKKLIFSNENDVNGYFEMPAKLKAMITGDPMSLESKNKDKISVRFQGVMIQCLNSYVKFRDRTDSLYRRFLMVPFLKRFTGAERKYIKDDYLRRPEVLEYVLWKVLQMPEFKELPEPEACKMELENYKDANDPLRVFLAEILPELAWSTVPFTFLYDLYKEWIKRNNPGGKISSKSTFENDVMELINTNRSNDCYTAWEVIAKEAPRHVPQGDRNKPEPLIKEYNLREWMNPHCPNSNDANKLCISSPKLEKSYRGGIRRA